MFQHTLTAAVLGICSYTDLKWRRVYKSVAAFYLMLAILGHVAGNTASLMEMAIGIIPGLFFFAVSWVSGQSLGYGDSLLIAISGASLGFWPCVWTVFTAFFWSGIWGIGLYRFRRENRKKEFPFVPFLFLGFVMQWIGGF